MGLPSIAIGPDSPQWVRHRAHWHPHTKNFAGAAMDDRPS